MPPHLHAQPARPLWTLLIQACCSHFLQACAAAQVRGGIQVLPACAVLATKSAHPCSPAHACAAPASARGLRA